MFPWNTVTKTLSNSWSSTLLISSRRNQSEICSRFEGFHRSFEMQATRRAAHRLVSQSLLRSTAARAPLSCAAASSQRTVPTAALCATASDVVTLPRSRWWPSPHPAVSLRIVPVGIAGALSFSMTLVTVAEAKEPPSPERIPKDVVLYQYEACPFCNKVKGSSFFLRIVLQRLSTDIWCKSSITYKFPVAICRFCVRLCGFDGKSFVCL